MRKRRGFTLAEVLITLGIIGVVAAMTIPTLMANSQKQQYVVGLKKSFSLFNQALQQMSVENGSPNDLKGTGIFGTGTTTDTFGDELVKYFKVMKNCKSGTASADFYINGGCRPSHKVNYDGTGGAGTWATYWFVTQDGTTIGVENDANNCTTWNPSSTPAMTNVCGSVIFDVNGLKGPNALGRDFFRYMILNQSTLRAEGQGGYWKTWNQCSEINKDGRECAARVMEENWQMTY